MPKIHNEKKYSPSISNGDKTKDVQKVNKVRYFLLFYMITCKKINIRGKGLEHKAETVTYWKYGGIGTVYVNNNFLNVRPQELVEKIRREGKRD